MKVITLNTWGGRGGLENLLSFFKKHQDVDVFCLQEVWNGGEKMVGVVAGGSPLVGVSTTLLNDIAEALPDHRHFFRSYLEDFYGIATFVRKDIEVLEEGERYVYKEKGFVLPEEKGNHARSVQYVKIKTPRGERVVMNIHALWNGNRKVDDPDRLLQSDKLAEFVCEFTAPYVLAGDFNLFPDTESIKRIERCGTRNLITEYKVTSTRTSLYKKDEPYADYIFTSTGIDVKEFKVLPDVVSDHAPLFLEFE